jgi:hypothetical protein
LILWFYEVSVTRLKKWFVDVLVCLILFRILPQYSLASSTATQINVQSFNVFFFLDFVKRSAYEVDIGCEK